MQWRYGTLWPRYYIHDLRRGCVLRAADRLGKRDPVRAAPWLPPAQPPPLAGRAWPAQRHQGDIRAGGDPPRHPGRLARCWVQRCPPAAYAAGLLPLAGWGASRPARGARRCPCRPADGDARAARMAAATRGRAQSARLRPAPCATIRPRTTSGRAAVKGYASAAGPRP